MLGNCMMKRLTGCDSFEMIQSTARCACPDAALCCCRRSKSMRQQQSAMRPRRRAKLKGVQERSHRLTAERKTLEAAQATLDTELVQVQHYSSHRWQRPRPLALKQTALFCTAHSRMVGRQARDRSASPMSTFCV